MTTNPTPADVERLIADAEALSAMIHMGEKIAWGQDTAMIDRLVAALRAMQADMAVLEANKNAAHHWRRENLARAEAAEAKLAEVEKERDAALKWAQEQHADADRYATTVATLTAQVEAMRGAAAAVRARYMGDNNREDQEVLRCEAAILALIKEAKP